MGINEVRGLIVHQNAGMTFDARPHETRLVKMPGKCALARQSHSSPLEKRQALYTVTWPL